MKRVLLSLTAAFCLLAGLFAQGRERPAGEPGFADLPGKWWKVPTAAKALELREDQVATMDRIFADKKSELIECKGRLAKANVALQNLAEALSPDRQAVFQALENSLAARAQLARVMMALRMDVRAVLSPEQVGRMKAFREEMRRTRGWRQEQRRERPPRHPRVHPDGPPSS